MTTVNTQRRQAVMARSIRLGHCVCNPRQPCPCDVFIRFDVCQCAGEKLDRPAAPEVRLTRLVRRAGCASKISQADLKQVIAKLPVFDDPRVLVGVNACDDAGVIALDGDLALVQTVDVFTPVVDDPYTFGRIAAANSLSDVYAMGGTPVSALTIIGFPIESMSPDVMAEILRGGAEAMHEAGVAIVGGHSMNDEELKCGFAVTGTIDARRMVTNAGAQPGDALVVTKPLGSGVISFAAQIGRAPAAVAQTAEKSMTALNNVASDLMLRHGAHACTDVTGFGLIGHLAEMARQSRVTARLDASRVPLFAGAADLAGAEIMGGGVDANRDSAREMVSVEEGAPPQAVHLFYDPQTSGGLLVALPAGQADAYVAALHAAGIFEAARIGEILPPGAFPVEILAGTGSLNLHGPHVAEDLLRQPAPADAAPQRAGTDAQETCCASDEGAATEGSAATSAAPSPGTPLRSASPLPAAAPAEASPAAPSAAPSARIPSIESRFKEFMKTVSGPGALTGKTKKLMAIALAAVTKCEPCLKIHTESGRGMGLTQDEIDEAIWVAVSFGGAPVKMFCEAVLKDFRG